MLSNSRGSQRAWGPGGPKQDPGGTRTHPRHVLWHAENKGSLCGGAQPRTSSPSNFPSASYGPNLCPDCAKPQLGFMADLFTYTAASPQLNFTSLSLGMEYPHDRVASHCLTPQM